jgi:putative transport protein
VLFVALAVGWFAPKACRRRWSARSAFALFLYAVGIQYGKQFFLGLTSAVSQRPTSLR